MNEFDIFAVSNEDVIDSRDIESRYEDLNNRVEAVADGDTDAVDYEPLDEDEQAEYEALVALNAEGQNIWGAEWSYGVTLVREDYFTEYAQQLAEDVGAIDREAAWPLNHIDWDAAADALLADYTDINIDGTTYYGPS